MKAVAWVEKAEAAIEARETVPHDQEVDANTAGAKEKSVTERCSAQPQRSKNEETMGNDDRIQNTTDTTAEITEAVESDNMIETCDDRQGHRMMTDEDRVQCRVCRDHFSRASNANDEDADHPKRDMDAEKSIDNVIENEAVRPMRDMDAEKSDDTEIENDAVRPKRDIVVTKLIVNAKEEYELFHKCDEDAAKSAVDEDTNGAAASKKEKNANGKAAAAKKISEENCEDTSEDETIRRLIEERRGIARGEKQHLKEVSQQIRKCIRNKKRSKRQDKIQGVLEELRGINNISCIEPAKKRMLVPKVENEIGDTITSRKGIVNVFGEFYSKIFADDGTEEKPQNTLIHEIRTDDDEKNNDEGNNEEIPMIIDEEIQTANNKLKKIKVSDNNGIRAEDIKNCDDAMKEMEKQIFNEVLKQESCTPEIWRRIRIKVLRKKGNEKDVGNYRPICTLPALYKIVFDHPGQQTLT